MHVRTPHAAALHDLLAGPGVTIFSVDRGLFEVSGLTAGQIGDRAAGARLTTSDAWRSRQRVTLPRVIKSEWIKFWSLRSTWVTLLAAVTVFISIGVIASSVGTGAQDGGLTVDPTSRSMAGTMFAQLILGALGVLLTATEHSTGMIRSTLAGVPRRLPRRDPKRRQTQPIGRSGRVRRLSGPCSRRRSLAAQDARRLNR